MSNDRAPIEPDLLWLIDELNETLDPVSRVPRYEQLTERLEQLIHDHRLPPGAILPREPDLARALRLSRKTVNQALTGLARRGLLERRRGIGTFVTQPYIEQPLDALYSFIRTLVAQGHEPSTRMLGSRITVDPAASTFLTGRTDGLITELSRLRLMDGEPLVIEEIFLPLGCADRLPTERLLNEVLYDLLSEICGIDVTRAQETLQPVVIDRTGAALLGIEGGTPAFLVERRGYAGSTPVEFRRSQIRGDRYRYRVELRADALFRDEGPHMDSPSRI